MTDTVITDLFKVAEVELVYCSKPDQRHAPVITTPADAYQVLMGYWDLNRIELVEEFKILMLDRQYSCLGINNIASGGYSGVIVDPKLVFATALKARAHYIILAHNHPSGTLKPSQPDKALTERLALIGTLLDLKVTDHLIVTKDGYHSFADTVGMPDYNKKEFNMLFT